MKIYGEIFLLVAPPSTHKSTLGRRLFSKNSFEFYEEWLVNIKATQAEAKLKAGISLCFSMTPTRRELLHRDPRYTRLASLFSVKQLILSEENFFAFPPGDVE